MNRSLFLLWVLLVVACRSPSVLSPPTAVVVSNPAGQTLATQEGPLWVLLSGVDEHGLIAEHLLTLWSEPDAAADASYFVHSGVAAAVMEIRQSGPQNLQRFYRVETVAGESGWISDYYVRRVVYLYDETSDTVALYAAPNGSEITRLPNISPVAIQEPTGSDWWQVQPLESDTSGWVPANSVVESPLREFLQNQQHAHE